MIGLAERHEGLYHLVVGAKGDFASSSTVSEFQHLPQEALWHFHLGHLSHSRLQTIHEQFPLITVNENSACDVCC